LGTTIEFDKREQLKIDSVLKVFKIITVIKIPNRGNDCSRVWREWYKEPNSNQVAVVYVEKHP